MIIIAIVISIFFIVVIAILCRSYTKDIFELENRVLQLEKRINDIKKELKQNNEIPLDYLYHSLKEEHEKAIMIISQLHPFVDIDGNRIIGKDLVNAIKRGEDTMACKKGRGGRKK